MSDGTQVIDQLESAGFRAAFLPFSSASRINEIYEALPENSADTEFIRGAIDHFRSKLPPDTPFEPRSFLVVSYSCPEWEIRLNYKGKLVSLPIPPTYPNFDAPAERRLKDVMENAARGWQLAETRGVSVKLLAALSGLGKYGRNNICYVDGFGSYCNFKAYYTDVPVEDRDCDLAFMDICRNCGLCADSCPTGAIGERPVIDAARCLTMCNESKEPMPDWIPANAHHALVGCMRCQWVCPANRAQINKEKGFLELSANETEALLSSPADEPPDELAQKLSDFGMDGWFIGVAARNAKLALAATGI